MYSYLITLKGQALVVITEVSGLLLADYILNWYADKYAFERNELGTLCLPRHIKYKEDEN